MHKQYPTLFPPKRDRRDKDRDEEIAPALSWRLALYDLSGDDIRLKREWLKTNILDVFDHLAIKKVVVDRRNKEIEKINKRNRQ